MKKPLMRADLYVDFTRCRRLKIILVRGRVKQALGCAAHGMLT